MQVVALQDRTCMTSPLQLQYLLALNLHLLDALQQKTHGTQGKVRTRGTLILSPCTMTRIKGYLCLAPMSCRLFCISAAATQSALLMRGHCSDTCEVIKSVRNLPPKSHEESDKNHAFVKTGRLTSQLFGFKLRALQGYNHVRGCHELMHVDQLFHQAAWNA